MDHLKRMAIFAKVVEQGSMSAAGRLLTMSPSAVSQQIKYLEKQSGITLLHRSTRKLTLTEVGQRYYFYCQQLCQAAEQADALLDTEIEMPCGELRLALPVGLAHYLLPYLSEWASQFPHLTLNLQIQDQYIDLIDNRIDVAIRVGEMPDSSYIAQRISTLQMGLFASEHWLNKQGMPSHPHAIAADDWLSLSHNTNPPSHLDLWQANTHHHCRLTIKPKVVIDNIMLLQKICEQGQGICCLSILETQDAVAQKQLIHILPDWQLAPLNIWAVTAQRASQSAKVVQVIEQIKIAFSIASDVNHID